MTNAMTVQRQPLATAALHTLVDGVLETFITAKTPFTAYSVTSELRKQFPLLNIVHNDVRDRVWFQMGDCNGDFANRGYVKRNVDFNGQSAVQFEPGTIVIVADPATPSAPATFVMGNAGTMRLLGAVIDWDEDDDPDDEEVP